jgi:hypothetical protein
LNGLQTIFNEDMSARLAAAAVQGLFAVITILPTLVAAMPTTYGLMLEVKERYAPREVEVKEIHQVTAAVQEPATTEDVDAIRTKLADFNRRLATIEVQMTREKEAVLASVTTLESKRSRRVG